MNTISDRAILGDAVQIGNYCVIEDDVQIGANCILGHHVVIRSGTRIGESVRIDDHTSIGKLPMRAANSAVSKDAAAGPCIIGSKVLIGSNVVLYAGSIIEDEVLLADFSSVREHVSIGAKTIVGRGVAIENHCSIGASCKLETNAYIAAFSEIGDFVFIAPGVLTSNDNFAGRSEKRFKHFKGVTVRRGGRLGVGSVLLPGREVHEDGLVAAGSVVTRDVAPRQIVAGVPARTLRDVDEDQLLENQNWFDAPSE